MNTIFFEYAALLSILLLLSGCRWFRDDRPEPIGTPYVYANQQGNKVFSSDEAVNAAVSSISLRMAVSPQGTFRIIPKKNNTALGFQVIDSLAGMRLSRPSAPHILLLEDTVSDGTWTLVLSYPDGREFLRKSLKLKDNLNGPEK